MLRYLAVLRRIVYPLDLYIGMNLFANFGWISYFYSGHRIIVKIFIILLMKLLSFLFQTECNITTSVVHGV